MTVGQHLELVRRTQPGYDDKRARELLATFRLDSRKRARRLSKGQQTALALIVALAHNPSILILDEPASGLDPVMQRAVLDLLIDAATGGATILLSSHQIGQIERAADRVAIMRDGRVVVSGVIDDLRAGAKIVEATFEGEIPALDDVTGASRVERAGRTVRVYANGTADVVAGELGRRGGNGVRVLDRTLEDIFLDAVSDGGSQ
jgi:ABC-2 type transport system ATP-binding protein